ncbi:hypothetical protein [Bifidobacterium rousetti]|uniref:hypothetical protein n=1 Tax=Bifidobacterium rousetti TaxID=2045439 RepID=UPI00168C0D10|nr:hypothetical protein [Bifidobacterium rousetti]
MPLYTTTRPTGVTRHHPRHAPSPPLPVHAWRCADCGRPLTMHHDPDGRMDGWACTHDHVWWPDPADPFNLWFPDDDPH